MGIFGQAKDLYKLQKEAKKVKSELKNLHIEAEVDGIVVTVSAEMEVIDVKLDEKWLAADKKDEVQKKLQEAINKGLKKAQEVAAEKMQALMGGLGMDLPGMPGLPGKDA